jgi:uncharacterized integral membrane protein
VKTLRNLLIALLILIAISFSVVNRSEVTIELWPLPLTLSGALGFVILAAISFGILIGIFCALISKPIKKKQRIVLAKREKDLQGIKSKIPY